MATRFHLARAALACVPFVLVGCGDRINHGEVTGLVSIDGQPVTAGNVLFISEDGRWTATGPLHGDGVYAIREAPLGKVRIAVQTLMYRGTAVPPSPGGRAGHDTSQVGSKGMMLPDPSVRGLVYKAIPEKYEQVETSGLSKEVVKGDQRIDLPLTAR